MLQFFSLISDGLGSVQTTGQTSLQFLDHILGETVQKHKDRAGIFHDFQGTLFVKLKMDVRLFLVHFTKKGALSLYQPLQF